jgi:GDP-4-dehydro-6-deoxy-D-mannose reductase
VRVLVTGITGFAGPHVAATFAAAAHEVHGLSLGAAPVPGAVAVHEADLLEQRSLDRVMAAVRPEAVVHLAAVSFVPAGEADPRRAVRVNVEGTVGVMRAMDAAAPGARLLLVGSGDAYGRVAPEDLPIRETVPLRPLSVYGATKASAEVLALQWARRQGRDVVIARPFNHAGPGQSPDFVVAAFARQIARIACGRQEPVVRVGDLSPVRDVSDVRDVACGYLALLERAASGEVYNLCSGRGVAIREVLDGLIAAAGLEVRVETDPALVRPVEVPRIVGSHARATRATGWRPAVPLVTTLTDVLADWRGRVDG